MPAAPLPLNEPERLRAVRSYDILDTPAERAFDRVAQLAARVFQVPVAFVSLMDAERQWLKACVGWDVRETRRDVAFCAYTLHEERTMVVPDATRDPRFAANPLVTGTPGIRFYAGAPLVNPEGFKLGTLCLVDTKPRTLAVESIAMLEDMAEIVVDELELRRATQRLMSEIQERLKAEKRLAELASRDALTGLFNRTVLNERLEVAIANAHSGQPSAFLYLDLDTFKIVNDTLGHAAGDRLLIRVAEMLRSSTRPNDTITRFGGDEFAVILDGVDSVRAVEVADRIRGQFEAFTFSEGGKTFNIGASIGVVMVDEASDREQVVANADAACYAAKARGRNRVEVFRHNPEEIQRLREDTDVVAKIHDALRNDRLELWFQPVVNLKSRETEFHEALLRLRTETGEVVMPSEFLPSAVRFGISEEIDRRVVRLAADVLQAKEPLHLFVNLSAKAFNNPTLLGEIRECFASRNVAPERVIFEITETEIIRNLALARELINELRSAGFRFALDDFGSGVSNLAYLKTLPLDYIKIDGSFIRDVLVDKTYRGFVKAINEIAAYLKVKTIAEYVENEEVLKVLQEIGVQYGQGYHLGRPAPLEPPAA